MFPVPSERRALAGFQILQRLGAGGVGAVYLAKSKGGKLVAIKVFDEAKRDEAFADALLREASLCARLSHPAIVQVRAFIEQEDATAIVFEYVAGVALARVLRYCAAHGVRLPDPAAWHIVERVLSALSYAHLLHDDHQQATPIVHRDVSPSNVLVDWSGGVKLTDFGMAKMLGVSPATRFGLVKGTLGCMAPEQARGDRVTERADVYAAALLAWRLATGRVPFAKQQKDEYELLRAMRNPRIKPLAVLRPDLPEAVLDVVASALEPDPEKRTLTASAFAEVVRANFDILEGRAILGELLTRWKPGLERTVKKAPLEEPASSTSQSTSSSGGHAEHTLRYEEVALGFDLDDDDVAQDGPTFVGHALPDATAPPTPRPSTLSQPPPPAATLDRPPSIPRAIPAPAPALAPAPPPALAPAPARSVPPPRPMLETLPALHVHERAQQRRVIVVSIVVGALVIAALTFLLWGVMR